MKIGLRKTGQKQLQGCMADGTTREQALTEIEIVKNMWIETANEEGITIPEPFLFCNNARI